MSDSHLAQPLSKADLKLIIAGRRFLGHSTSTLSAEHIISSKSVQPYAKAHEDRKESAMNAARQYFSNRNAGAS